MIVQEHHSMTLVDRGERFFCGRSMVPTAETFDGRLPTPTVPDARTRDSRDSRWTSRAGCLKRTGLPVEVFAATGVASDRTGRTGWTAGGF